MSSGMMDTSREPLRCWIRDMHVAHMQKAHVALARFSINLPPGPKSDIALNQAAACYLLASMDGESRATRPVLHRHFTGKDADSALTASSVGLASNVESGSLEAASIWRAMLAKAPSDAPWRPLVQAALERVGGSSAPALSDDAMAAAKDMNETDRGAMIRGMVERLASRLKQNGDDVEGWLRLVRAYMVMGDRDKAKGALTEARQAVANDAERLRQLNEGLKNLGLDG